MAAVEAVATLLRPWLGQALLTRCDVCEQAASRLWSFDSRQGDFADLYRQLDTLLFHTVHDMTEGDMRVLLDDGRIMRVRVDDIDQMADEVLYLALRALPRSPAEMARVRQYALTHDSLSALRALYVDFAPLQTPDELRLIARTARACHPAYRWRVWLPDTDDNI